MSHIERRHKEKEEIKQKILDAACLIADQEGWGSLTIRKIAEKIEYTPPIVYEYFENKEDLIREIVENGFKILHQELINAVIQEKNSKEVIKQAAMIQWDFAVSHTKLYQLMFNLEKPIPNEEMMKIIEYIDGAFLDLVKDKDLVQEAVLSWICLMAGAISLWMKLHDVPDYKTKLNRDTFARLIDRFIEKL